MTGCFPSCLGVEITVSLGLSEENSDIFTIKVSLTAEKDTSVLLSYLGLYLLKCPYKRTKSSHDPD